MLLVSGCATEPGKKTAVGAGVGALVAAAGAVIGHQSGERDKGALVGGLLVPAWVVRLVTPRKPKKKGCSTEAPEK